ncbi:hypothetical protein BGZ76_004424 [Entomortierella beljakovae]|nr:hypothetical protein BGZ76_004424 [Entomortierella beljakovae]
MVDEKLLLDSLDKTKQALSSEPVIKAIKELEQCWNELGLNHFEHVMDYTNCLSLYCEQLPQPELTFIVLATQFSHYLAIDKFLIVDDATVEIVQTKYLTLLQKRIGQGEMEYYKYCLDTWIASRREEIVLKKTLPAVTVPTARHFMWADWRSINIGMAPYMRMVMMINFPNEKINASIVQSSMVYISMQTAYLNDMASVVKDKDSDEVNYFLEVTEAIETQEDIFEESNKYLEIINVSDNIRHVLKAAIHGSYLMYTRSKRFSSQTQANW